MTYLALPRPPGFKPRHARKTNNLKRYAISGAAAAVAVVVTTHPWSTEPAATAGTQAPVTVFGEARAFSCAQASSYGHPAGTAWKLSFTLANPATEKVTYYLHWSLADASRTAVATGVATVKGVDAGATVTKSGTYTVTTGETAASTKVAVGDKLTCRLDQVQRLAG
ncbi:hypothetical protein BJ973_008877 [Actinoplanes tereljensis]|uniref:Uncharacterized protein n=1 Tax=Paractinoplanes tereljensis TaxID=571912 RepID=A0A919NGG3_9ACTN|nr:hypothetical protein [Actinoplanes tereljensis]GIF18159.1 hypothetical protein Ate02nite_08890 [Actinoplanes tereljensis]